MKFVTHRKIPYALDELHKSKAVFATGVHCGTTKGSHGPGVQV